ncbi:MAG: hypothetical protein AB7K24_05590, partial [Gemmataceae bacterium]
MPDITMATALKTLTRRVERELDVDELLEVYHELFPEASPRAAAEFSEDSAPLVVPIVNFIHSGLAPEELVDLWSLVFSEHRDVWYNE